MKPIVTFLTGVGVISVGIVLFSVMLVSSESLEQNQEQNNFTHFTPKSWLYIDSVDNSIETLTTTITIRPDTENSRANGKLMIEVYLKDDPSQSQKYEFKFNTWDFDKRSNQYREWVQYTTPEYKLDLPKGEIIVKTSVILDNLFGEGKMLEGYHNNCSADCKNGFVKETIRR